MAQVVSASHICYMIIVSLAKPGLCSILETMMDDDNGYEKTLSTLFYPYIYSIHLCQNVGEPFYAE